MKLTFVLLTACLLHASAKVVSQNVSFSGKDIRLEALFPSVEKQTGFIFIYKEAALKSAKPVTINAQNVPLEKFLEDIFKDQPLNYDIKGQNIIIYPKPVARSSDRQLNTSGTDILSLVDTLITVRGRVVDSAENPIEGATVRVKGSTKGTITDEKGYFMLDNVDGNTTLLISSVNMEAFKVKISGRGELFVSLKTKVSELEDVVVSTGYQNLPKERATGSFTQINNKLYNEQVGFNVLERLKYITNGLTSLSDRVVGGEGRQLLVRGLSSLTLTIQKPLIILDNFEYHGDIDNINPNDIDNVTILKDAAAASIWGARAGNGVIVLTTKKGRFNEKIRIEANANVKVQVEPDLFYLKKMSTTEFIDLEQFLFDQGAYDAQFLYPQYYPISQVVRILDNKRKGLVSTEEANAQINALRNLDIRNDYKKYVYETGVNQQYALNVRGGTNNITWILSTGFDRVKGFVGETQDRFNLRLDNTYKASKRLEINTSIYYTQSNVKSGKSSYGSIPPPLNYIAPYTQLADETGSPLPVYNKYDKTFLDTLGEGKLLDWRLIPLEDHKHQYTHGSPDDINATIGVNYKIVSGLSFDAKYHYQKTQDNAKIFFGQESHYTIDLINSFSQLNRNTGLITYIIPKGDILDLSTRKLVNQDFRWQLNFNKSWRRNNFVAIAGSQVSEIKSETSIFRTYGYNGESLWHKNVNYANAYPNFIFGSQRFIPDITNFNKLNTRFVSFYANAAYTFDDRYSISLSGRRDAANSFGLNTNDKWKPLWSVGGSWDLHKEAFYNLTFIPYLKLRATYGFQGNVDIRKVAVTTFKYVSNNRFTQTPFSEVDNFYNPDLRWEQVGMLNLGLTFKLKDDRITGSIEFYRKKTKDLYALSPIDVTTGLGPRAIIKNVGSTRGTGWDIEIKSWNVNGKFKWSTNVIVNLFKDKVLKNVDSTYFNANNVVSGGYLGMEGYPTFAMFGYKWGGLDPSTGDPIGYLNKELTKDYSALTTTTSFSDLVYFGSLLPQITGAISNTFSWKNISLTANIVYKFGYYFRLKSINYNALVSNGEGHSDYSKRWQKPGDELITYVPSFVYPVESRRDQFYKNAEILVRKGDHVRLQYINLSYDFGKIIIGKTPLLNLQTYIVADNLGIIWRANKEGVDPEFTSIPPSASIACGIRIGL